MNPRVSFDVVSKQVLISGGRGGIGSTFARAFAAVGARVTAADLKTPGPEIVEDGISGEILDVTDDSAVDALARPALYP